MYKKFCNFATMLIKEEKHEPFIVHKFKCEKSGVEVQRLRPSDRYKELFEREFNVVKDNKTHKINEDLFYIIKELLT